MINGLPEKLRKLRTESGMSQKQAAERLGLSPSVVSGYETGERTPSAEVLLAVSYLFHCGVDYRLGRSAQEPSKVIDADGLTDKQVRAVRALVEALRES